MYTNPENYDGLDPRDALERYLRTKERNCATSTVNAHEYRLNHLIRWSEQRDDIDTTADYNGRNLNHDYREWRIDDGDLAPVSIHTQLATLRVFIKWLGSIEACHPHLYEKIELPDIDGKDVNEEVIDGEKADEIIEYLDRFQYASRDHVVWVLLYGTGMRLGGARSLDVNDYDRDEDVLRVHHRPEADTPLKNGSNGERTITLSDRITSVLDAYIDHTRPSTTDDYGREPLLSTDNGRVGKSTIRRAVYRWTQPCQIGKDCPHGYTKATCETAGYTQAPSGCPSIVSPHSIRKRCIIQWREEEVPDKFISDRANVSQDVIDKNYDLRNEDEKAESRRDYFS